MINVPPRLLKSHTGSIAFPAWLLGHDPATQVLAVSYAQDLSDKLARDCRALMTSPFYQSLFGTRLSVERNARLRVRDYGGRLPAVNVVRGVVTGRGADVIVVDDAMKPDDALSDARRLSVHNWYDTLRSRLIGRMGEQSALSYSGSCGSPAGDGSLGSAVLVEQRQQELAGKGMIRVQVPQGSSHWVLIAGRKVALPPSRIIEVNREELPAALRDGGKRVD